MCITSANARHAGVTKYPYRKLLKLATDGLASFSTVPLRLALNLGFIVSIASFLTGIVALALRLAGVDAVPGWASIVVGVTFLSGVQLTVLGVMGEYIARIHEEVKQRPLYLVARPLGRQGDADRHRPRGPACRTRPGAAR